MRGGGDLEQRSPTFLARGTGFLEDNFSTEGGCGSGGNASDGERPMKLRSLAHRSSPAVWPRGLETPDLEDRGCWKAGFEEGTNVVYEKSMGFKTPKAL